MDINWDEAPEGATHYCIGSTHDTVWRDLSGVDAKYWYQGEWHLHEGVNSEFCLKYGVFEERPVGQAWNGEGLPPVGTVCEHEPDGFSDKWVTVEVLAHREFKGHDTGLLVVFATEDDVSFSSPECFRPIKTKEQLAAEEREKEIDTLCYDILSHYEAPKMSEHYLGLAKSLYEAGYRKQENNDAKA